MMIMLINAADNAVPELAWRGRGGRKDEESLTVCKNFAASNISASSIWNPSTTF